MAEKITKEVAVKVSAEDGASATLQNVQNGLERLGKSAEKANVFQKFGRGAKETEELFGEERGLKKLLEGGLIGFAGEKLAGFTAKIVEMRDAFREGKIGAGEMLDKIAAGIPIIGGFWQAGRNLRELFDDEALAARQITEEAERTNKFLERQLSLREAVAKSARDHADFMQEMANKGRLRELGPGKGTPEGDFAFNAEQLKQQTDKAMQDRRRAGEETIKKIREEQGKYFESDEYKKLKAAANQELPSREVAVGGGFGASATMVANPEYDRIKASRETAQRELSRTNDLYNQRIQQAERDNQQELKAITDDGLKERGELQRQFDQNRLKEMQESADELALAQGSLEDALVQTSNNASDQAKEDAAKRQKFDLQDQLAANREREQEPEDELRRKPELKFAAGDGNTFVTGIAQAMKTAAAGDPQMAVAKQQLEENRKQRATLERVLRLLERGASGGPIVIGVPGSQ